jgi:hypothetical protein
VAGTTSWSPQVAAVFGHTDATSLPNVLYPQTSGYSAAAGDCTLEGNNEPTGSFVAPPGGTTSTTIPLGLLALQLVNSSGAPVSGASVTLTSTTCGASYADAYDMPVTDGYGLSVISVPYGTYSYTVTIGGSSTAHTTINLNVGSSSVVESVGGNSTTYYLPSPVQVPA